MPNPISHAEMIAWLRHLAALAPGVTHVEPQMADAVLGHLNGPVRRPAMNEDSMPSKRMVPEQKIAELSDEMVRLAAAKDEEIAALTEQHDKALAQAVRNERNSWADQIRGLQKGKTELDLAGIKACAEAALIRPGHVIASAREVLAMIERMAALTEQRDRAMTMLRKIERILVEDTNAEDDPCCGWGPLLAAVRAALDTPSSPSLPESPQG